MTGRPTITRHWRPDTRPAESFDDFVEVTTARTRAEPAKHEVRVIERRSIGRRLENWGAWANFAPSRGGASCEIMTAVICENMRRLAGGEIGPAAPADDHLDIVDAERINAGIPKIAQPHRMVLHWTYVVCVKPRAVAGACGFPSSEYGVRLAEAQAAIEAVVGGVGAQRA